MPRSTSATTTPAASSTAIPTIALPSNATPSNATPSNAAQPIDDEYEEDEGSGSGDESDDEDLAHPTNIVVAPGKVVSSKVINPNLVSYDVKLFLRSKKPNQTAITDEFLLTLRNQFPTIKSLFFEITSTDNVDNAVVGKLRISPAIEQMEVMVNNFIEQSNGREVKLIESMEIIDGRWYGGNSFEKFNFGALSITSQFDIGLKFRTRDPEGLLLWVGTADSAALAVVIFNGELELSYGKEPKKLSIKNSLLVNDQKWHTVVIKFNRGALSMTVDEGTNKYEYKGAEEYKTLDVSSVFVGGIPELLELSVFSDIKTHKGFTGCLDITDASADENSRYLVPNKEKKRMFGPVESHNVGFCDGRSACQSEVTSCAATCEEINAHAHCQTRPKQNQMDAAMTFNGHSYAAFDLHRTIDKIELNFDSSSLSSYVLFHVGHVFLVAVENGFLSVYLRQEPNQPPGLAYKETHHKLAPKSETIVSVSFQSERIKVSYCQSECLAPVERKIPTNHRHARVSGVLVLGKLHASEARHWPADIQQLPAYAAQIRLLQINGDRIYVWERADIIRAVEPNYDESTVSYNRPSDKPLKFTSAATYNNMGDTQVKSQEEITIRMKIKTSELEGTLLYMSNNDHSHSLKVFIRHGFLVAKLIMDDDVETELESVYVVAENEWKEVEIKFNANDEYSKKMSLMVEQWDFDSDILFTSSNFESNGLLYIGGVKSGEGGGAGAGEGFGGCVSNVVLNSRPLDLYSPLETPLKGLKECRSL